MLGAWLLPLCSAASEPRLLSKAAEQFAEQSLSLPPGSAHAQAVDQALPLGTCEAGWIWSFPYEARTTVQVSCAASPSARRYVSIRYEPAADGNLDRMPSPAGSRAYLAAARDLPLGHVISAEDLETVAGEPKGRSFANTLSDPGSLVGQALTRQIRRGEALGKADARPAIVVKRNSLLTGLYVFPGGQVYAKLLALENGKAGDWINLENPQSGRKLKGRVLPDGTVQVSRQLASSISGAQTTEDLAFPVD